MRVNLLGHCLMCLEKTNGKNSPTCSAPAAHGSTRRVPLATVVNKVMPLLLDKQFNDIFSQVHFCSSGDQPSSEELESSPPPPLCPSCFEQFSSYVPFFEQMIEDIGSKIAVRAGGRGVAFQSLLRGSEEVEEEIKEDTLRLLDCMQQSVATTTTKTTDDDDGDGKGSPEKAEEEFNLDKLKTEKTNDGYQMGGDQCPFIPSMDSIKAEAEERMKVDGLGVLAEMSVLRENVMARLNLQLQQHQEYLMRDVALEMVQVNLAEAPHSGPKVPKTTRKYPCPVANCGKRYAQKGSVHRHFETKHGPLKPKADAPYLCIPCDKGYKSKLTLQYHVESKHLRNNYICEGCGHAFSGPAALKKHHKRFVDSSWDPCHYAPNQ